jgi:hypothetical protein
LIKHSLKPKLSIGEQIDHLLEKGVTFDITDKNEATNFLTYNSYYFKLKSYCKNYDKKPNDKYINLEFAYLQELSTLDMYFRRLNIRLTLDIEHMIKTKLMYDFNQNNGCNGYTIVSEFLNNNLRVKDNLNSFRATGYTAKDNIISKYHLDLAIWNFIEIVEFGTFIEFCNFYYDKYPNSEYSKIKEMLWSVKCLRNSSAHNNCLLHNLRPNIYSNFRKNMRVTNLLKNNIKSSTDTINKKMSIPTLHDFIISLLVYKTIVHSKDMKSAFFKDLHKLINIRFRKNVNYFQKNTLLQSHYSFLRKFIVFLKKS